MDGPGGITVKLDARIMGVPIRAVLLCRPTVVIGAGGTITATGELAIEVQSAQAAGLELFGLIKGTAAKQIGKLLGNAGLPTRVDGSVVMTKLPYGAQVVIP